MQCAQLQIEKEEDRKTSESIISNRDERCAELEAQKQADDSQIDHLEQRCEGLLATEAQVKQLEVEKARLRETFQAHQSEASRREPERKLAYLRSGYLDRFRERDRCESEITKLKGQLEQSDKRVLSSSHLSNFFRETTVRQAVEISKFEQRNGALRANYGSAGGC